jgi:hypothetical protein
VREKLEPPAALLLVHGAGSGPLICDDWAASFRGIEVSSVWPADPHPYLDLLDGAEGDDRPARDRLAVPTSERSPPDCCEQGINVTCDVLGHKLEDGVPIEFGTSSSGYYGKNVTSVTLKVSHNRDGSVTASCHTGNA